MVIAPDGNNLDLLMNVPLTVTAELGTAKMLVRDILKLGTGSVVELDRLAGHHCLDNIIARSSLQARIGLRGRAVQ